MVSALPQRPIHLRPPDRPGGRGYPAAPDPRDLEAEMFRAGDIEAVRRDEQHLVGLETEPFLDQLITFRMRFEFARAIDANGLVEKRIKAGILDQSGQHGGAAV